jgi:hypothetical protein
LVVAAILMAARIDLPIDTGDCQSCNGRGSCSKGRLETKQTKTKIPPRQFFVGPKIGVEIPPHSKSCPVCQVRIQVTLGILVNAR